MPEDEKTIELKPEQKKILSEVFAYSDEANYSEEDMKLAREMFDRPEKFMLLRKILQVLTPAERGLTYPSVQSLVQAETTDLNKYALETAISHLADERIRHALVSFFRIVKGSIVDEMKAGFDEENQKEFEEKKRTETYEKEKELEGREVGENL